jgi:uncharacterized protein (DUF2141 family)
MTRMAKMMAATAAAGLVAMSAGAALAADVVVNLKGVDGRGGVIFAGLQTREQFMKAGGVAGAKLENPTAGTHRLVIRDVPPGEYSLGVLHDTNGNEVLDRGPDGWPAEGVATGPSRAPLTGPPTFDQVKLVVPAAGATVEATLWYADKQPGR